MKILVLAHNLRCGGGVVIGSHAIKSMQQIAGQHDYFFIVPQISEYEQIDYGKNRFLFYKHKNLFGRFLFDALKLRRIFRSFRPDFVLGLGNFGLSGIGIPQAILIHRPHLVYPDYKIKSIRNRLKTAIEILRLKRILPDVQLVFCQTETMKSRFLKKYDYKGEVALFPAVAPNPLMPQAVARPLEVFKAYQDKFRLFQLGLYYEHKNLELSVRLFREHGQGLKDVVLFITISGEESPGAKRVLEEIKRYRLERFIVNIGPIERGQLMFCYRSCNAVFFPSLLESFSVTYVEAMRFGLPILTSDLDFARDICGDAAVYFNPNSVTSARDAILKLKNDPGLQMGLIDEGGRRLSSYPSWDVVMADVVKKIEEAASQGRG